MATVSPTSISALPTPPSTSSPSDFDAKADAFLGALPTLRTQVNDISTVNYNNAVDAYNNATTATTQATIAVTQAAAASASAVDSVVATGAPKWITGTTYALGNAVWSPITQNIYRRIVAGAGSTDPSNDTTNWAAMSTGGGPVFNLVTTTTKTAVAGNHYALTNVAATTITLPASPSTGAIVWVTVANGLYTNVINRNGSAIMNIAENMTLDKINATVQLRYINATLGWCLM